MTKTKRYEMKEVEERERVKEKSESKQKICGFSEKKAGKKREITRKIDFKWLHFTHKVDTSKQ